MPIFSIMWPKGFDRIPTGDSWVSDPVDEFARQYDDVEHHSWYRNIEPTLDELARVIQKGDVVLDYSAGTGLVVGKLLRRLPEMRACFLLVDASAKFLRLALEKLRDEPRVAFRLIRFLRDEHRLERLDEILPDSLKQRGFNVLCSTNAIHLYPDVPDVLRSWNRSLRPEATLLISSGNISNPKAPDGTWIIDDTIKELQPIARDLVHRCQEYAPFRPILAEPKRMAAYDDVRRKFFLPVRPLDFYVDQIRAAGFEIVSIRECVWEALVSDWSDFLDAYHEGVLGWAGGSKRIEGRKPAAHDVDLRRQLLRESMAALFAGQECFHVCWTYLTCRKHS